MKQYDNIAAVIDDMYNLQWFGSLFTNHSAWRKSPLDSEFLYLECDDELEDISDQETLQPRLAHEANVRHFLDSEIFIAILKIQADQKPNSTIHDYITALNYYREFDTVMVVADD